jgi:hypothetical protein
MKKPRVPKVGEFVFASGLNGRFKVISVDEEKGQAALELTTGTHHVEKRIPFNAIRVDREDVNQAAARVVREATEES